MRITEEHNGITYYYDIAMKNILMCRNKQEYQNLIITCRNLLTQEINKIGYLPEGGIYLKIKG